MTLADLIAPGSGRTRLHFLDESISVDYGELWKAGEAMGCLRASCDGKPVAVVLTNSRACATAVVGAVAAGQPLVSVPMPARGAAPDWYARFIQRMCALTGAEVMLVDRSLLPLLPPMEKVSFVSFEDALSLSGPRAVDPAAFTLTQFTSGSTAEPKGVVLSGDKIVANLLALVEWLEVGPGDHVCTWLPLSHDMGLMGTFLGSLTAAGDRWARGLDLALMTPQGFLRGPARWLSACEEYGATITVAPNYAYDMAARKRGPAHDLRRLRTCVVGAEPIRVQSLERFSRVFGDSGFDPTAFCPAYGMAEAALAVTGTPVGVRWHATEIEPFPDDPRVGTDAAQGYQVVSSGVSLPGYGVRIDGDGIGEILVKGPSVADSYTGGTRLPDADGWFHTRDLGVLRDGQLYVLGRTDDVFHVAGRNVYALDVEAFAAEVTGVRSGRVVAIPENGDLTLVAECEPAYCDRDSAARLAQALRQQIVARLGVRPRRVLLTRRGVLPMTSSGKIRRKPLAAALQSSEVKILAGSLE
ncbi:AMP-binding protein [Streptomyces canus]|uniref:AMP-binding protein n=1 Tax=Streptomyces canus TaxID=58343 RepID=UPI0032557D83